MSEQENVAPYTRLVDVGSAWEQAAELPFANQDSENIITEDSLLGWMRTIARRSRKGMYLPKLPTGVELPIISDELQAYYHKLRFLSMTNALKGLKDISVDIKSTFDPETSLLLVNDKSNYFIYSLIAEDVPEFSVVRYRSRSLEARVEGRYAKPSFDSADKLIILDDWILSGEQFPEGLNGIKSKEQLYTYHLVMSDKGKRIYDLNGFNGKCAYRIIGDGGPNAFFGTYPLYGFHKVPDVIPELYTDSARDHIPGWSIFPDIDGYTIGATSRLVDYYSR